MAPFFEDSKSIAVTEILELKQAIGKYLRHALHELGDEFIVFAPPDPRPVQADIEGVFQQGLVIGSHIE